MANIVKKSTTMKMRIDGFTRDKAIWWLKAVSYSNNHDKSYTQEEKDWAYDNGFLPQIVDRYGINSDNIDNFISVYDYEYIYPVNDLFRKWLNDRVTTRNVLKPYKDHLPEQYYHIYIRDMEPMIICLLDCPDGYKDNFDDILRLIRDKGRVCMARTTGYLHNIIKYENETYYFDDTPYTGDELIERIQRAIKKGIRVITEYVEDDAFLPSDIEGRPNILRAIVYNKYGDNPKVAQAYFKVNGPDLEPIEDNGPNDTGYDDASENTSDDDAEAKETDTAEISERNSLEDQIVVPKKKQKVKVSRYYYMPVNLDTGECIEAQILSEDGKTITKVSEDYKGTALTGEIPHWKDICATIEKMCMFIPQIEYMGIDIVITKDGFKFVDFTDHPYYPQTVGFNEELTEYLQMIVKQKKELHATKEVKQAAVSKRINNSIWQRMAKNFSPKGMRPHIYKWWYMTVRDDFFSKNGLSVSEKMWAYKHGFLSYRIPQYGITEENYQNFISDYDYRYIRHINNKYRVWLEDKLTVKYICSDYSQFFPKYYYQYSFRNGEQRVIRLMDLPEEIGNEKDSVLELVKLTGDLACKPQRGSQGQGFYKLSYRDGVYYMNHEEANPDDIIKILADPDAQYIVTEYIRQHPTINDIYSGAVNTMRIITFMKDGKTTEIGNAYLRFGSKKTGAVDNMGAGGMFSQVDMETGRFYNGKIITENEILPCKNHPDTGVPIEGYIPNWDIIRKGIVDLNKCMPQLEYLGFDVAITEDGMKLPEINRAPGYPKIETFNRKTIDYLLYKRNIKMAKFKVEKTKW